MVGFEVLMAACKEEAVFWVVRAMIALMMEAGTLL
jgi:hypothetical protein